MVVVTNACGSSAIRRTRCARRSGSSSLKTSSSRSNGGAAVERGQQVELGELEGQDRRALLAARRESGEVTTAELERDVVAMRPDERGAVPDLLVGRLDEPTRQGVARRLAGQRRRVRHVAEREAAGGRLVRGDLAMRRGERLGERVEQGEPGLDDPSAGLEERPSQNRSSSRVAVSSRMARSRLLRCWSVRPYVARSSA